MIRLVIPGEPCPKGRPRMSVIRGRPHVYVDAKTLAAEETVRWHLRSKWHGPPDTTSDFVIGLHFYCKSKKSDWDNLSKLFCDAANGIVWKDDRQVAHAEVTVWRVDANPHTEITIKAVSDHMAETA